MFKKEIKTRIEIEASAEKVWSALANLALYSEWNPMIRRAEGEVVAGSRLTLFFNPAGTRGRIFRPKILVAQPCRKLSWQGQPGVRFLFESEHIFMIEPSTDNSVTLAHEMIFYGLLIPLLPKKMLGAVTVNFNDMNMALKERSEKG